MNVQDFDSLLNTVHQRVDGVEGWLSPREVAFLTLAAACPTAPGDVLEIGSYRGRSTIALALAARYANRRAHFGTSRVVAIDPMLDVDPKLQTDLPSGTARRILDRNLTQAGVVREVEFHPHFSYEVAPRWNRPLRLLWIDGDHAYASTKQDFDLFSPHLADGAILAFHDVLSPYDGCIRVFTEDVLTSPQFGAAGLCGSIGWAQFWTSRIPTVAEAKRKETLLQQLQRLVPYHCGGRPIRGVHKWKYKWLRARVPHRKLDVEHWGQAVA